MKESRQFVFKISLPQSKQIHRSCNERCRQDNYSAYGPMILRISWRRRQRRRRRTCCFSSRIKTDRKASVPRYFRQIAIILLNLDFTNKIKKKHSFLIRVLIILFISFTSMAERIKNVALYFEYLNCWDRTESIHSIKEDNVFFCLVILWTFLFSPILVISFNFYQFIHNLWNMYR